MSSLRELATLSNSSGLEEKMLYANRLKITKSCLIFEELNRLIGYLTCQINFKDNLIEELRQLPASFVRDIAIMYNNIVCAHLKSIKCSIMHLIEEMVHVSHIIENVIMPTKFSSNLGIRRVRAFNMNGPMCHPVDICVHFGGKLVRRRLDVLFRVPMLSICQPYGILLIQQKRDLEWIYRQCEMGDVLDMYFLYDDGDDDEGWYLK
ncbi:hypothetical protein Tco_1100731 [Tanacetum coccineum]